MKRRVISLFMVVTLLFTACGAADNKTASGQASGETQVQEMQSEEPKTQVQETQSEEQETDSAVSTEASEETELSEEELMETINELISNLAVTSHKAEYAESITEVIASLSEEKPESSLKQKDVDCDTLQWFNATYAMFVHSIGRDYHDIGGYNDEFADGKDDMKSQLEDSWGIVDRQTAIETLLWLAEQGHVGDYQHTMQMMGIIGLLDCTDEQFEVGLTKIAEEEQVEDIQSSIEYYGHMREINSICQDNGIDAWDYCRIMQISGNSYYCGYLTLEECLSIQLATSLVIQDQFDSWQELNDSYYYGYSYWAYGSYAVGYRKMMYNDLAAREDSPWKVLDFDMPLEKFW